MSAAPGNMELITAASVPAQPWRNGGGQTRELLVWPAQGDWRVRISRADIDRDGPFSAFPLVERWFAVLRGRGVALGFENGERTLRAEDDALCFDGAAAPACRLLDGPTQDLNLMLRAGTGTLCRWQSGRSWDAPFTMRGLYTTVAGRWTGSNQTLQVPADTLLWSAGASAGVWTFEPRATGARPGAWWLGCTPQD